MNLVESMFSKDREIFQFSKKEEKELERIHRKFADSFQYEKGLQYFSAYIKKHPYIFQESLFMKLGFFLDHLALKKEGKEKKELNRLAILNYTYILSFVPHSYRATWGIGRVYWHQKNKKGFLYAKQAYRLAKKSGAPCGLYVQHIGLMYAQIKDYKNAEKWLKKALKEKNNDWGIYLNLMNFYTSQLNYVQAKKYGRILREKIKVEPKSFFKSPWGQFVQNNISEVLKKK